MAIYTRGDKTHILLKDTYLLTVSRYIHLNYIRVKEMVDKRFTEKWRYLQTYRWRSFKGYLNKKHSLGYLTIRRY